MNEKEVSELRRRLRPDKNNISRIRGCYVNENGQITARLEQSMLALSIEERESCLGLFKKVLSGGLNKNLVDISFATAQVASSPEHALLMALRNSELKDEEAVGFFFERVAAQVRMEGSYLILLACDSYDVPYRGQDGGIQREASDEMFRYLLCSVCPVKTEKPALSYYMPESEFHNRVGGTLVAAPEMGFLFPAFDDRAANIYDALFYTKDVEEGHPDFVQAVFNAPMPMPAGRQKQTFEGLLSQTLEEECSLEVVQAVHERLRERIEVHKMNRETEPLTVSSHEMERVLKNCGVQDEKVERFGQKFAEEFGEGAKLSPRNIVEPGRFEVKMPDVVIRVSPERSDLIETRVIDGVRYLLICADEGVEVNGVNISLRGKEE